LDLWIYDLGLQRANNIPQTATNYPEDLDKILVFEGVSFQ
jgi:hypothetical protein